MGEETSITTVSSEDVTLEAQKTEVQDGNMQEWTHDHLKLASLSMKLSDDDCKKFARLKVRCLLAEGRLRDGNCQMMIDNLAKQVDLSWTCRKIERINAFHKLHQLVKLKSDVTEELSRYKNKSSWTRKLMDFRSQVVNRMNRLQRILVLLSQYIDKATFITEYKVVKELVANMSTLKWRMFLLNASGGKRDDKQSKPDDARYEKVLDELLKPLVSSPKHNLIYEDYDVIQNNGTTNSEKSGMDVERGEEIKTNPIGETESKTVPANYQNEQPTDLRQTILSQTVQTVELHELASQRNQATPLLKISGGFYQYDPQSCSFLDSKGLNRIGSRKRVLTVVGKPISASMANDILEEAVPVLSLNRNSLQENDQGTGNRQQNSDKVSKLDGPNGSICYPNINKSTRLDIAENVVNNCIIDPGTANGPDRQNIPTTNSLRKTRTRSGATTLITNVKATRKRGMKKTKNQNTISASFEQQLKQLCLKKKCVVKLERIKETFATQQLSK